MSTFLQADLQQALKFPESEMCIQALFPPSASLRSELNHIHASAIEHLRQTHQQESAAAKMELEKTLENNRTQVGLKL